MIEHRNRDSLKHQASPVIAMITPELVTEIVKLFPPMRIKPDSCVHTIFYEAGKQSVIDTLKYYLELKSKG